MKPQILFRRIHYWASIPIVVPLLVIISSGLLLHLKKNISWIQPQEQRGGSGEPAISLPTILDIARTVRESGIGHWDDVYRIEFRPARGIVKVVSDGKVEIQIDAASGQVLQVAKRRSDVIESIHDGSWFHPLVKTAVFLPVAIVLLGLLLSGTYLFFLPILARTRRRHRETRSSKN